MNFPCFRNMLYVAITTRYTYANAKTYSQCFIFWLTCYTVQVPLCWYKYKSHNNVFAVAIWLILYMHAFQWHNNLLTKWLSADPNALLDHLDVIFSWSHFCALKVFYHWHLIADEIKKAFVNEHFRHSFCYDYKQGRIKLSFAILHPFSSAHSSQSCQSVWWGSLRSGLFLFILVLKCH